jgi:multidrug efflux pump subunit AcrA (membrane-fusion protein)
VHPVLQRDARTIAVRIVVSNPDGRLKPGMFATVRLSVPAGRALSIPISAVVQTGERNIVFVDVGAGELLPVEVELGRITGDYAEVLIGLEPGQRVVTSAQFLLESESNLAEVMKAMMSQMNLSDVESMDMDDVPAGADMRGMDMRRREQ